MVLIALIFLIFSKFNQNSDSLNITSNDSWLKESIIEESNLENVWKCEYKNQIVYFFEHGCCDFMNPVYNKDGEIICSLGGFTGAGDGKCPDFETQKSNCENLKNFSNCAKAGEISFNDATGESKECCAGLVQVENVPAGRPEKCEEYHNMAGYGAICTDCGNDVCEGWENQCNCIEDCPYNP